MFIKNFTELGRNDAGIAGGKGASLGEMTQAGIPVPPGFVVLSESFEQFLRETDLGVEIDTILHTVDTQAMHTVEHASERIQKLILEAKMPADIKSDIASHFEILGATYVAVRSSATAEDSASAAWAGQLDSFLNTTEVTLFENVQRCWASLFTPRAIFYRFEQGLHATKISVAVVVQKMVESEVSGIAFSVHPVTEDRNQLIIEAGYGLGEAIVSGQITPDSYVVEKSPRRIIDKNIVKQERGIYRAVQTANEWREIETSKQEQQKLTDEQILELSEIIVTIENHYGFPCDIEWALEDGKFYIVQSRPITTLSVEVPSAEQVFQKNYTRDSSFAIQQSWGEVCENLMGTPEWQNPHIPMIIDYLREGAIEIWENTKGMKWLMERLRQEGARDPEFYSRELAHYRTQLEFLKSYWKKGAVESEGELARVVDVIHEATRSFLVMYLTAIDENTSAELRAIVEPMRREDVFFEENDKLVRRSLTALHPEIAGYEIAVMRREILAVPSLTVLKKRSEHFVVIGDHYQEIESLQEYADKHPESEFLFDQIPTDTTQFSGVVGFLGKVQGRARIIRRKADIPLMQVGEILVAPMTTPDYLPAMKQAVAFITDEGGMLCHAAIIAREMKKPCIIGTKIATQVLKDGDLVQVNADTGVVRIVERVRQPGTPAEEIGEGFVKELDGQELFPPMHSSTLFTQTSGWNTNAYFSKYYSDTTAFPLLISVHKNDGTMYIPVTKVKHLAEEVFGLYWQDTESLQKRLAGYTTLKNQVASLYKELVIEGGIDEKQSDAMAKQMKEMKDTTWNMNALALFSIYFDKEMCAQFLAQCGVTIERKALDVLWEKVLEFPVQSFEKRREQYVVKCLEQELTWEEIGRYCQYFEANYNKVQSQAVVVEKLKENYGHLREKKERQSFLKKEKSEAEENQAGYEGWYAQLSDDEKKLARYIRSIIELRDDRKDSIAQFLVVVFSVAEKIFQEIGMSPEYIFFCTFDEILQGKQCIEKNRSEIEKRKNGFVVYVDSNGKTEMSEDAMGQAQKKLETLYLSQQQSSEEGLISGQSGSTGKVQGRVRIIKNIHTEESSFVSGEVLVTGMTRPEFVPLMKKAIAIVTDEGGITCHAAIVSRELGLPCVIGTKIATQVLHDGDLVEVDADNGVVRILEREKKDETPSQTHQTLEQLGLFDKSLWGEHGRWIQPPFVYTFLTHWHLTESFKRVTPGLALGPVFTLDGFAFYPNTYREILGAYIKREYQEQKLDALTQRLDTVGKETIQRVRTWLAHDDVYIRTHLREFVDMYTEFGGFWSIEVYLGDQMTQVAKEIGYVANEAAMFAEVHKHLRKTWIEEEVEVLAEIAREYTEHPDETKLTERLADFREKFRWMRMVKWSGTPLSNDAARERFEEELKNYKEGNYIVPKHSHAKPEPLVGLSVATAYWRAECGRIEMETGLRMQSVLQTLADTLGLSYEEILLFSPSEIVALSEGKFDTVALPEILKRRGGFFSTLTETGRELLLHCEDPQYQKLHTLYLAFDASQEHNVLEGIGAAPGKATGRVRVLHSMKDGSAFQDGEILVAPETTPSFVPFMRLAKAILTGKGGITSHAAIVSRELKKPCIIAIKNVTKILKTGDLVEVDADNGVVRILESGNKEAWPRSSDYEMTFESRGTTLLFEDIVDRYYNPSGTISTYCNGTKKVYTSYDRVRLMSVQGKELSMDELADKEKQLDSIINQAINETTQYAGKADFSKEDALHMLELLGSFCKAYYYFDMSLWDETFQLSQQGDTTALEKVRIVTEYKNKVRAEVDPIFFDEKGYFLVMLRRIAEATRVSQVDLMQYRIAEVLELFDGNILPTHEVTSREESYVYKKDDQYGTKFYSGKEALVFIQKFFGAQESIEQKQEITGTTAHSGKIIRGKVRLLLRDYGDAKSFQECMATMNEGDILVSPTTDPEMMPALRKAGAIVTNIGGLLSHSAIVARELNIPCIVGTKIATDVLHDGDLVEVDADNGVVRILKNSELDRLIESIKEKEWVYIVKRPVVPLMIEMIFEGERQERLREILQESVQHVSNIRLNDGSSIYSKEGIASVNEAVKNIVSKDGYDGLVRLTEIFSERMKEFLEYLKGEHITLEGFRRQYTAVSGFLVLGVFPEKYLTEELQRLITKKCGTFDQDYFSAIAYPSEQNDATKEVLALIDLALMMRREGVSVRDEVMHQKIEEHLKSYAWLGSRWSMEDGFTEHDMATRLENYLRSSALEEEKENIEAPRKQADNKTKEFIVRYDLDDDERKLVMAVKTFCFFRTHRSESLVKATFLLKRYIEQHPQEFPFVLDDIKYLTVTEILSDQTRENIRSLIQERKKAFVGVSVDGVVKILSGLECQGVTSLEDIMKTLPREVVNQEIMGQVGFGGVVHGRVKIVASEVDIAKVCSGDILVATMTFPHYIAAMEAASGFVTDEGGILCHAAIIAREMKKPCIIGTRIATQVLKDGDLVEVDAEQGIVKILEKAK